MDRNLRPCKGNDVSFSLECAKDTFFMGEAPVFSLMTHNCSDKRIFVKRSGCDTKPSFLDQIFEVSVVKDGKTKLKTIEMSVGCGITGLYPVFPGGISELKLNLLDWADLGEPGTYRVRIGAHWKIYTRSDLHWEVNRDCPECVRTIPVQQDWQFVVLPGK